MLGEKLKIWGNVNFLFLLSLLLNIIFPKNFFNPHKFKRYQKLYRKT